MSKVVAAAAVQENFIYNLRLLRRTKGLSGKDLSKELGMHPKRINNMEVKNVPPSLEDLVLVADYFKISFDKLISEKIKLNITP